MGKMFTHVDGTEKRLVTRMQASGLTWAKIQEITGRSSKTLRNVLHGVRPVAKGRPMKVKGMVKESGKKSKSNKTKTLLSALDDLRLLPGRPVMKWSLLSNFLPGGPRRH